MLPSNLPAGNVHKKFPADLIPTVHVRVCLGISYQVCHLSTESHLTFILFKVIRYAESVPLSIGSI